MNIEEAIKDIKQCIQPSVGGISLEIAIEALEKQIPRKPKIMDTTLIGEKFWWYCGHCGASRHTSIKTKHCSYCGGKVDWE